ncbi:hypothetical protein CDAR_63811 [Caerostris darwini]|uniref:Uncharacterized protein n=1 Tax=Caerostris darwini TaxID=1538125 RepID=A0AAV4QXR2_9ARAC|nr:hypothetical protein CDAR_63811 [Caerostris darwini]
MGEVCRLGEKFVTVYNSIIGKLSFTEFNEGLLDNMPPSRMVEKKNVTNSCHQNGPSASRKSNLNDPSKIGIQFCLQAVWPPSLLASSPYEN